MNRWGTGLVLGTAVLAVAMLLHPGRGGIELTVRVGVTCSF